MPFFLNQHIRFLYFLSAFGLCVSNAPVMNWGQAPPYNTHNVSHTDFSIPCHTGFFHTSSNRNCLGQWFLTGNDFVPREHATMLNIWRHFWFSQLGGWGGKGMLMAHPRAQRPGMLLNHLQCTRQSPQQRNIPPRMLIVMRLRNFALG